MSQFSYSFCITLFHSIWQAALLLLLYATVSLLLKNQTPGSRRNMLYGMLFFQLVISVLTFLFCYVGSAKIYLNLLTGSINEIILQQPLLQQYAPALMTLYAGVVFLRSIAMARNWLLFKNRQVHRLIKPSIHFKSFTLLKVHQFGIKRSVGLWFSNAVQSPLTYGFFRPVIILPIALINNLSITETESLIIHELTHIRNNDYLLNWSLVMIETVYFFNPFIRSLCNKIRLEREKDCDLQVLQFKYPAVGYAETLLKAARFKRHGMDLNFSLAAVFGNKELLKRIHFFTKEKDLVYNRGKYRFATFLLVSMALLLNLALLSVSNEPISRPADTITNVVNKLNNNISFEYTPEKTAAGVGSSESSKLIEVADEPVTADLKKEAAIIESADLSEENFSEEVVHQYAIPVVDVFPDIKEVIIEEENSSTGEIVTKAFSVEWKDGKWKDELLYIKKQGKPLIDSIGHFIDSTIRQFIPAMQ